MQRHPFSGTACRPRFGPRRATNFLRLLTASHSALINSVVKDSSPKPRPDTLSLNSKRATKNLRCKATITASRPNLELRHAAKELFSKATRQPRSAQTCATKEREKERKRERERSGKDRSQTTDPSHAKPSYIAPLNHHITSPPYYGPPSPAGELSVYSSFSLGSTKRTTTLFAHP